MLIIFGEKWSSFSLSKASGFDKRKKTITRTSRIRQERDSVLHKEASRQGGSVNILVNKILRKYTLYSRWNNRNNGTNCMKCVDVCIEDAITFKKEKSV